MVVQSVMMTALMCSAAPTETRPLAAIVPADAMAVYFGQPPVDPAAGSAADGGAGESTSGQVDQLAGVLMTLKATGVIPREGRLWADLAASLPVLSRRPHALVLLDITAKEIAEEAYRLNELNAALVLDSGGMAPDIDRRIRDLLRTYSNADDGSIERIEDDDGRVHHRLVDTRLPGWTLIEWGEIDSYVLITVGEGTFAQMAAAITGNAPSLDGAPWFSRAERRLRLADCTIGIHVDLARIEQRVGEVVEQRASAVLAALSLDDVTHVLWVFGMEGRVLRSDVLARKENGHDRFLRLTGPGVASPDVEAMIPADAPGYAIFRFAMADAFRAWHAAYMESQSAQRRERFRKGWALMEQMHEFDTDAGLLAHLGEHVVLQPYPAHPLGLPLLTLWIEIDPKARDEVSRTVDHMMAAWQENMNPPEGEDTGFTLQPRIRRSDDGLWYLQLGIVGPALAVTDRWIVISYSPQAVRTHLQHLSEMAAESQGQSNPSRASP